MNFINGQATNDVITEVFSKKVGLLNQLPIFFEPNGITQKTMTTSYDSDSIQSFLKGKGNKRFNAQREDRRRIANVFNTQAFVEDSQIVLLDPQNSASVYANAEIDAYAGLRDLMNKAIYNSSANREFYNSSLYGLSYNLIDKTGESDESDVIWIAYTGREGVYGFTSSTGFIVGSGEFTKDTKVDFTNRLEVKGMGKQLYGFFGVQQIHPLSLFKISLASGATGSTIKSAIDEALGYIIDEAKADKSEIQIVLKSSISKALASAAGTSYISGSNFQASFSSYDGSPLIIDGYVA